MARARFSASCLRNTASIALAVLPVTGQPALQAVAPADFSAQHMTCESPVRLTHDCSIWQGPTRPIAVGEYRMTLAAGSDGRTILVSRLRPGPSHNGNAFSDHPGRRVDRTVPAAAIERLGAALGGQGIHLERMQPVRRGQRIDGYFLEFSSNAYDFLKQFTVLESEHWLPPRRADR